MDEILKRYAEMGKGFIDLRKYREIDFEIVEIEKVEANIINIDNEIEYQSDKNYSFDYDEYREFHPVWDEVDRKLREYRKR